MQATTLQGGIFEKILRMYPSKSAATDDLTKLLGTSKQSLYRKINEKSALKPDEIVLLAQHYSITLDDLVLTDTNTYMFHHTRGIMQPYKETDTEDGLMKDMIGRLKNATNLTVYYTGAEVPIFYLFHYPRLLHFKKYIWNRLNSSVDDLDYELIDFTIPREDTAYYEEIARFFETINTIELWDSAGVSLVIEQVIYAYNIGVLPADDARELMKDLTRMLNRLEQMLKVGSKYLDGSVPNLEVYFNPVPSANWLYIIESDQINYTQAIFDTPNSLLNMHPKIQQNVNTRFAALKEQSHLISLSGTTYRKKLFANYHQQVQKASLKFEEEF